MHTISTIGTSKIVNSINSKFTLRLSSVIFTEDEAGFRYNNSDRDNLNEQIKQINITLGTRNEILSHTIRKSYMDDRKIEPTIY